MKDVVEYKVGDKLIYIHKSWMNTIIRIKTIVKVNKASYKLDNGFLVTKDLMSKSKLYGSYSTTTETYFPYTDEKWNELKLEMKNDKYNRWKSKLEKDEMLNVEHMKRYIEECDK